MSERATPFYCPYCGDEDLEPHEGDGERGAGYPWACRACQRVFRVKFVGLRAAGLARAPHAVRDRSEQEEEAR